MPNFFSSPVPQFTDASNNLLSGGKLFTYITGSSTKSPVYSDATLDTEHSNPIILNSRGEPDSIIYLDPAVTYRFRLSPSTDTDPPTAPIWTHDKIFSTGVAAFMVYAGDPNGNVAGYAGAVGGAGASIVYDTSNGLIYVCTTTGTSSTAVWTAQGSVPGAFATSGVITPSAISSQQNDYNPSGLSAAAVLRLSSSSDQDITGIAGGSTGRILQIYNIGSSLITLKDANASSTAANRFSLGSGRDLIILPGFSVVIQYDATSSRWKAGIGPVEPLGRIHRSRTVTDDTTFNLGDMGGLVIMNAGTTKDILIPTNANVALPYNPPCYINVATIGAGTTTVTGDTGVTVNGQSGGVITMSGQYSGFTIAQIAADTWLAANQTAS